MDYYIENITYTTMLNLGIGNFSLEVTNNPNIETCIIFQFVIYSVLLGILCVVGITGNLLAFIVFQLDTLKTSTTFLFQGLSLMDSFLLMTAFPLYCIEPFSNYMGGWWFSYNMYIQAYMYVYVYPWTISLPTTTIWVTVLVAINRYIAVCTPYRAPHLCSVSKAKKYLAIVVVMSFMYNIPRFLTSQVHEYFDADNVTVVYRDPVMTWIGTDHYYKFIYGNILYSIFLLVLPLLILTVLNILLITSLQKLKRKRAVMQTRAQQQDNNVTFVLILVVLLFIVCQTPALINQILWNFLEKEDRECGTFHFYFSKLCNLLVLVNSAGNFVIYFMFNSRFKQVMLQIMCGKEGHSDRRKVRTIERNGTQCNQTLLTRL